MFALYFNRKTKEIEIKPYKHCDKVTITGEGEIARFNNCLFISFNRKALRNKAKEIQETWIREAEAELEQLKAIKVKNRY